MAVALGAANLVHHTLGLLDGTTTGSTVQLTSMAADLSLLDIAVYTPAGAPLELPAGANEAISFKLEFKRPA